jgi:hypothetical protein
MVMKNVVNTVQNEDGVKGKAMNWAAAECGLAINTFKFGHGAGYILAQQVIEGDMKNAYGFDPDYIKEIKPIFRSDRTQGATVFTPDVIAALEQVNSRWRKRSHH